MGAGAAIVGAEGIGRGAGRQAPAVIQRAIPSSGELVPVVGMGTWQTFDVGSNAAERTARAQVLRRFAEGGGRVIDSSPMYGSSEAVYGALADQLGLVGRMFVATKVWTSGRDAGIRQMRESMRLMRAEPVDLMQVHNLVDAATHLRTLRAWKDAGQVRYIGVTHYQSSAHDEVARVMRSHPLDFIQINHSIADRAAESSLLPLARDRGVAVLVNRPFGGGGLFGRIRDRPLPGWAADYGIASWAQLLLKYVVSHPAVTCAIPATSRVDHMADNLGAMAGALPDEAGRRRMAALIDD
jgi:diketogulonate reductase-like aldo/keto reductase